MAVSKVIIACAFIGIISRQVSSLPTKRNCDRGKTSHYVYHQPRGLQLEETVDIIIHNTTEQIQSYISLMTDKQTACTIIIKSDDKQGKSEEQQKLASEVESEGRGKGRVEEISLLDVLENSITTVSFTVRKNIQTDEICLDILGKNGYIKVIELDPDVKMEDIQFVKIVGVGLKVSELKFKFNLDV